MEKLNCSNCNAPLDFDPENMLAFCPYCGNKLLFDTEQVRRILETRIKEQAATDRTKIHEAEETKRTQERELTKRYSDKTFLRMIILAIASLAAFFAFCAIMTRIL